MREIATRESISNTFLALKQLNPYFLFVFDSIKQCKQYMESPSGFTQIVFGDTHIHGKKNYQFFPLLSLLSCRSTSSESKWYFSELQDLRYQKTLLNKKHLKMKRLRIH